MITSLSWNLIKFHNNLIENVNYHTWFKTDRHLIRKKSIRETRGIPKVVT